MTVMPRTSPIRMPRISGFLLLLSASTSAAVTTWRRDTLGALRRLYAWGTRAAAAVVLVANAFSAVPAAADTPKDSGNMWKSGNYRGKGRQVNSGNFTNGNASVNSNNTKSGANYANGSQCIIERRAVAKRTC
ncbi:hypothetical protein [Nonomuraea maritima]